MDYIINWVELLALPVTFAILLFLFFFLFVRPFFAYIFDPQRIAAQKRAEAKRKKTEAARDVNEVVDFEDLTIDPDVDVPDFVTDEQKIAKLASSDLDRGKELVKSWLQTGK